MEEKLREIMAAVFEVNPSEIHEDTAPGDLAKWDSLHHLNLITALEEEFNVEFSEDEMLEMVNYKLILLTLRQKV